MEGKPYQMDIWTSTGDQYPCQISIQYIPKSGPITITTWAFTGITDSVPPQALSGTVAKIQCTQRDWLCVAMRNASSASLQNALNWVCFGYVDCSPINPGGAHYYPNTLLDHCDWAYNAYFQTYKISQGYNACNFDGTAQLVPPSSHKPFFNFQKLKPLSPTTTFFSRDLVCPSQNNEI
eukprot:TRINITY_DN13976_c0_g1_i1.p1 TRINITY_DN13976_c0_g1~~TRINITY_DN13976_c0_g1_i1.p1  ORF type:complete len:186 (-),score=28.49 TRINITY_DN13976_c0_g1_i1:77-613(-)